MFLPEQEILMIFKETNIKGSWIIIPEKQEDKRGFFSRTFCREDFNEHALNTTFVQCNTSFNKRKGTIRGMHYQTAPYEETKLVRCTRGTIYDVIIDLRPGSLTFKQWVGMELTQENLKSFYIPRGVAHGFQTLADNSEVFYQMSEFYHPECARSVRWNDPVFSIKWPVPVIIMSQKDSNHPDFSG